MVRRYRGKMEEDELRIMRQLFDTPVISVSELAAMSGLPANRCYRLLNELHDQGKTVSAGMSRTARKQSTRQWLTAYGVRWVSDQYGIPIEWQTSETGTRWLIRRLAMLDTFYSMAPTLWAHPGVDQVLPIYRTPDPDEDPLCFPPDLKLESFRWLRGSDIHAVTTYENGAWVAWFWAGVQSTVHRLLDKADRASNAFSIPWREPTDPPRDPSGWVVVGYDRLAAIQSAEIWASNALAITVDGQVLERMRPEEYHSLLREDTETVNLGSPETLVSWVEQDPAMAALNGRARFEVFMIISEWYGITKDQIVRKTGRSKREIDSVIRTLVRAEMII